MPTLVSPGNTYLGNLQASFGMVLAEGGRLVAITGPNNAIAERKGLGDVATLWPEVTVVGSPQEHLEADNSRAVVDFKVPYHLRHAFGAFLVGWPFQGAGGYRRHLPEMYRNWTYELSDNWQIPVPATPVMYCVDTDIVGHGLRNDWVTQNPNKLGAAYYPDPQFENAIVRATFKTLAFDVFTLAEIVETPDRPAEMQRWVIRTEDSGGRYLQYQTGYWELVHPVSGARRKAGNRNQNYWESYETIVYEWFDVLPGMTDHARNQRLCGLTNHATFDGKPAGTLVLQRAGRTPRKTPIGQRVYTYRFEFLHVPSGVNRALPPGREETDNDPITGQPIYWEVVREGKPLTSKMRPYLPGDMTLLFKPDTVQITPLP